MSIRPKLEITVENEGRVARLLDLLKDEPDITTNVIANPYQYKREWHNNKYRDDEEYRERIRKQNREYYARHYANSAEFKAAKAAYNRSRYVEKKQNMIKCQADGH